MTKTYSEIVSEFERRRGKLTAHYWVPEYTTSAWDMMHLGTPQQKYKTTEELAADWAHDTVKIFEELLEELKKKVYPSKIIYNPPYTICYFGDDDKEIVKCSEFDEFKPDFGVMACIMRRMFSTRAEFDRLVESGHWQEKKDK